MASICLVLLTIVLLGQILANRQVCNNGAVKLSEEGGLFPNEKYIQFCHDGKWHSLCIGGGTWSRVEANVVCRQLGLSGQGAKKGRGTTLTANPPYFMFGDTSCAGGESSIGECNIHTNSTCSDSNSRAGWVKCQPANCTDGTVRLVSGFTNREGRVDFCTQGHWASICYNEVLADTVCKMLGFPMQGAIAKSTTSSIDPKVDCTVTDDGTTLNCGDTIQPNTCGAGNLVITCQTFSHAVQTLAVLGAVIGLLVLLEVGTVIAWVVCTVTRKRNFSSPKQRILTKVNESYNGTFLKQPNISSQDPNYDTVTTSDEAVGDYDVIDNFKPKPRALQISNPPPVTVEASN